MSTSATGNGKPGKSQLDVELTVRQRYSSASQSADQSLCCPVEYDKDFLKVLPDELIERDYGCGNPSKHVTEGETVLDLGSGGGKICYIASQVVGPRGRVLGVDMNDEMLALARKHQDEIAARIGWNNVEFHKGRIQDLALDLDKFDKAVAAAPIDNVNDWIGSQTLAEQMRRDEPMIADDSVDVVVSNCVLNLVKQNDRRQMFEEIFRVLRRGGRAVISDIVCDEPVPTEMKDDPKLWSGCISGAFVEHEFLEAFEAAGFYGIEIIERQAEPWATVEGIEFRSKTVRAYKGKEGPCLDHKQAAVYKGPWKSVTDDDGHVIRRGVRTAVCEKTFKIYSSGPYADQFELIPPDRAVSPDAALPFDCRQNAVRDPRETKNGGGNLNELPISDCCGTNECC